ncbi:MAG: hypothetical protein MI861_14405 [Pirellulales bacterium]|nr:hypothetical protein [Pirellulales bacterium]
MNSSPDESDATAIRRLNLAASLLYYYAVLVMFVGLLLTFVVFYLNANRPDTPPAPPPGMSPELAVEYRSGQRAAPIFDLVLVAVPAVVLGLLILHGSSMARQRSSYFSVAAAGLLCLAPCTLACIIGIPTGILVLALISQSRVRHIFRHPNQQHIVSGGP